MGRKTWIVVIALGVLVVALVGVAVAYDSAEKGKIADGVTVAGVDVGGLDQGKAEAAVRRHLLAPLRNSLKVSYEGESWSLKGAKLKIRADVKDAIEEAIDKSQEGGLPTRLVRYVTGGEVDDKIAACE